MQSKLREWGPVIALALIPALPLLLGSGLVNTRAGGDSPFLLVRVHQLVQNLRAGVFPVRWMPQAAYGLGFPFFNFYASLPYYLTALLKLAGTGYIAAVKWTQALGFVLAAVSVYGLCRALQPQRRSTNLLASLAYSCAPFHMVNVYVRGDSLSEFYAFIFFPLILWGLLRLHRRADLVSAVWVSLSYAGLILTHNISAVIFGPFALLYAFWLAWEARDARRLARSLCALGTGLLASVWFWLPALAEQGNVYLKNVMTTGYFHYSQHFRTWDLVQPGLAFDYAITADQQPFSMGLVQAMLASAGCVAVAARWIRQRRVDWQSTYAIILVTIPTIMITPLSRPLWDVIPLLSLVQFPWRFLSLQALGISLIVTYLFPGSRSEQDNTSRAVRPLLTAAVGLLVLLTAMLRLQPERLLITEADVSEARLAVYEYFTANVGTTIRADYLPAWVVPRPYTSEAFWQGEIKPAPLTFEGQAASTKLIDQGPTSERWAIEIASPQALLAFHTYYYPGWLALVDGHEAQVEVQEGLGYMGLRLPEGRHEVVLKLGRTRLQQLAEMVSLLTVVTLLIVSFLRARRLRSVSATTVLVPSLGAAVLLVWALLVPRGEADGRGPPQQPMISSSARQSLDLTMDFDRIPYLHHNPDGVRFGNAARLEAYGLSSEGLQAGEVLRVTTYWAELRRGDLTARVSLVSPAQHLFGVPLAIAAADSPLETERGEHSLLIPGTTARGVYLLAVQVFSPERKVRPVNSQGESLGTTYLLPIRVDNWIPASDEEPVLQWFGERIGLSSVEARQQEPGALDVTLVWRVLAHPRQNYKTALRLRDLAGREVAQLDTQPGYGFYPTSMWRPGELVHDRYVLPIDDGTPPGTGYSLDVTLYEAGTLRPVGTARVDGVSLTQPTVSDDYATIHQFTPALVLSEARLSKVELEQGEMLGLLLTWAAEARMEDQYHCLVALVAEDGARVEYSSEPPADQYPTSLWPKGAIVNQHYEVRLSSNLPAGSYSIALTVVESGSGEPVGSFTIPNPVRIVEVVRNFEPPEMQVPVGADFGGKIRLLGYDLQLGDRTLRLNLHWQALSTMMADYKVFVHFFDQQTEAIAAQHDSLAGGAQYPTTRWVPQEVICDEVALDVEVASHGAYRLAVGLYHGDSRLPVTAPASFIISADRLLLGEEIQLP